MLAFDASSMIYAWDNYPLKQFPPLWKWMALQIRSGAFVMLKVAFEEVQHKTPDCSNWLKHNAIQRIDVSNDIVHEALRIKTALNIQGDKYYGSGVDENDILIIATARVQGFELVSDEARQLLLPKTKAKMKIPAVCNLAEVGVSCVSFLELIKRSGVVFG